MKVTNLSEIRRKLPSMMDQIADDHEPVLIKRGKGKTDVVMMSLEDYSSFEETRFLLASPANAARLRDAIADMDAGNIQEHELVE